MSFNTSVLQNWNDVNDSMTIKAIAKNRVGQIPGINAVDNVVGSVEVPFLYSSPSWSNSTCNSTTSGSTSLGTTTVSTCFISMHDELCEQDLQGKTFSKYLNGQLNSTMPFEDAIAQEALDQVAKQTEIQWLQGNPSVAVNGVLCTGLYYQVDNTLSASTIQVTATAITASNGVAVMDAYMSNATSDMLAMDYIVAIMSPSAFQQLKNAYRNANLYAYGEQDANPDVFKVPGYNGLYAHSMVGATGNRVLISYSENFIYAYNLNNAMEMYYDQSKRKYAKHADFRIGGGIHFPDHLIDCN